MRSKLHLKLISCFASLQCKKTKNKEQEHKKWKLMTNYFRTVSKFVRFTEFLYAKITIRLGIMSRN